MRDKNTAAKTVDEYIGRFPPETQMLLRQMRETIQAAAPAAVEEISYMMPAYKLNGALVYFGGYEGHIGFYPGAGGIAAFKNEITGYKSAKRTVQFPLDRPLPLKLITEIVTFRVAENLSRAGKKRK